MSVYSDKGQGPCTALYNTAPYCTEVPTALSGSRLLVGHSLLTLRHSQRFIYSTVSRYSALSWRTYSVCVLYHCTVVFLCTYSVMLTVLSSAGSLGRVTRQRWELAKKFCEESGSPPFQKPDHSSYDGQRLPGLTTTTME